MKDYKKALLIVVLIIAVFIGAFFIFNRKNSAETSIKDGSGFDIISDKSNGVKLYLLDAYVDNYELYLNYDIEFGDHGKSIEYDDVSIKNTNIEERDKNKSEPIKGAHWSTRVNKEFNKINIRRYSEIKGKMEDKLRLNVEDIILEKRKKVIKKLDFNEESIEIEVNDNIVEKIVLNKPKIYGDEMVIEADIYKNNDKCDTLMEVYDGDVVIPSPSSETAWTNKNIESKKTIFELENHNIKDLVLEISYKQPIKEIKGKWSVDFEVDYEKLNNPNEVKNINKKVDLGEYSFFINKTEKDSEEIKVYTRDLKSNLQEKYMSDWTFYKVDFIYPKLEDYQHNWVDTNFYNNKREAVLTLNLLDENMKDINLDDLKLNVQSIKKRYEVREDYSECDLINLKNISKEEKVSKIEIKGKPVEIKYKRVGDNIELELISHKDKIRVHSIEILDKEGEWLEDDDVKTLIFKSPLELKNKYVQPIILKETDLQELNFVISDYSEIVKVNKVIVLD